MTGLGQLLITALLFVVCLAWITAAARLVRGRPLLEYEPRRPAPWWLVDVVAGLLLLLTLQIVAVALTGGAGGPDADRGAVRIGLLGYAIASFTAVALAAGLVRLRSEADWRDLGFHGGRWLRDVRVGVHAFLILGPIVYAMQAILVTILDYESQHPLIELLKDDPNRTLFAIVTLAVVLVAPLTEEFFFRVLLQGWAEKAVLRLERGSPPLSNELPTVPLDRADSPAIAASDSPRPVDATPDSGDQPVASAAAAPLPAARSRLTQILPIVLSASLFAAMHANHGPDPVPLFVLAAGLGFLYQRTHRLLPCVVLHMCLNGTTMAMVWFGLDSLP